MPFTDVIFPFKVAEDGYLKLIDFGYAKMLTERTYSVVGTIDYLAPEVVLQRGHWFGADWCVLIQT